MELGIGSGGGNEEIVVDVCAEQARSLFVGLYVVDGGDVFGNVCDRFVSSGA